VIFAIWHAPLNRDPSPSKRRRPYWHFLEENRTELTCGSDYADPNRFSLTFGILQACLFCSFFRLERFRQRCELNTDVLEEQPPLDDSGHEKFIAQAALLLDACDAKPAHTAKVDIICPSRCHGSKPHHARPEQEGDENVTPDDDGERHEEARLPADNDIPDGKTERREGEHADPHQPLLVGRAPELSGEPEERQKRHEGAGKEEVEDASEQGDSPWNNFGTGRMTKRGG
jgi:hypothetical protein